MREIFIAESKSKKKFAIGSWLIRLCEDTKGSHVFVYWFRKNGGRIAYQATGHGVNFCGNYALDKDHEIIQVRRVEIADSDYEAFLDWCIDNCGKAYSKLHLLGVGIMRLAALFSVKIKNPFADGEYSQVCVETVIRALGASKVVSNLDAEQAGMIEIEKWIEEGSK